MKIDPALKQWATGRQEEIIDAVNRVGSIRGAARELGIRHSRIDAVVRTLKKRAAGQGYSPAHDLTVEVPSPFVVRGTSSLYKDGKLKMQWVKTKLDDIQWQQAIADFVSTLVEDARGLAPKVKRPSLKTDDLLSVYPLGDPHFGMYAWKDETGDDFDLGIAEELTTSAVDRLVDSAPASEVGLLLCLGDFFHMDSSANNTPTNHNTLDVDTRWGKVMQVGLRALTHCVNRMREKHQRVIVRINKGNHDPHSSFAIALALDAYFSACPEVEIDLTPAAYWYYRHGKTLIGSTHGDGAKLQDLPLIMATDRPLDWGVAKHRYWYVGHVHHQQSKEFPGCVVESFRTLAARDAWHSGEGYRAGRDMRLIVLHKTHGEVERHRCDIAMLEAA